MSGHWLNRRRLQVYPGCLFLLYLLLGLLLLVRFPAGSDARGNTVTPDFMVFWAASDLALSGNAPGAYDPQTIAAAERRAIPGLKASGDWVYPPTFYLMVLPLALLPFFWSYLAFALSTFLAYVVVLRRIAASPAALMAILGFPAVCLNFVEGQNALLCTALMGAALWLLPARPVAAGVVIGLLTIKPQLGALWPLVLIAAGQWRALCAAALAAATFLAVSMLALGASTLSAFLDHLAPFSAWAAGNRGLLLSAPTFFSFFHLLGVSAGAARLLHGVVAVFAALAAAWTWRFCTDWDLRRAVFAAATLLISPYLLDYDLACLALAIAWFARYGVRRGWRPGEREMLLLAWLLPLAMVFFRHVLRLQLGPFVLLGLLLVLLRRARQERGAGAGQSTSLKAGDSTAAST